MTQPSHLGTEQPTLGPESGLRVQDSAQGLVHWLEKRVSMSLDQS